jgi:hypothetical protein
VTAVRKLAFALVAASVGAALACGAPRTEAPPPATLSIPTVDPEREPEPADAAEPDGAEDADISGRCADALKGWARSMPSASHVSTTPRPCAAPCRHSVRTEYTSRPDGGMPENLSRAQRLANDLGLQLVQWVPQDDGTIRYVLECSEG